jgi:ABC-type polar amino acid transport system ATPase subunit
VQKNLKDKLILALVNSRRSGSGYRNTILPPLNSLEEIDSGSIGWAIKNIEDVVEVLEANSLAGTLIGGHEYMSYPL